MLYDVEHTFEVSRLCAANLSQIEKLFDPQRLSGSRSLLLRFKNLGFVDSSGLGYLVKLRNSLQEPRVVVLEGISDPTILDLFALTRMDQLFGLSSGARQSRELAAKLL